MSERVLITGASGLLGSSVGVLLADGGMSVLGIRRKNPHKLPFSEVILDLLDATEVINQVRQYEPTVIVHAAALSRVLECESDSAAAQAQNVDVTNTLLQAASDVGAYFIFISTDQVFNGVQGNYNEADIPTPTHTYGKSKLAAEQLVTATKISSLILRSNNIVGRNSGWGQSFTDGILDKLSRHEQVELFHDQFRSPIHLRSISGIIRDCIENRIQGHLHVGGPEKLSRYETGQRLAQQYGFALDLVVPVSMATHPQAETLHKDGSFDTEKLCALFPEWGKLSIDDGFHADASKARD